MNPLKFGQLHYSQLIPAKKVKVQGDNSTYMVMGSPDIRSKYEELEQQDPEVLRNLAAERLYDVIDVLKRAYKLKLFNLESYKFKTGHYFADEQGNIPNLDPVE